MGKNNGYGYVRLRDADRERGREDAEMKEISRIARQRVKGGIAGLLGSMLLSLSYVWHDGRRHKRSFAIGTITVLIVVTVLCALQSTLALLPHIFLKLAEDNIGEMDFIWTPVPRNATPAAVLINQTQLADRVRSTTPYPLAGTSPRWLVPATLRHVVPAPPVLPGLPPRDYIDMPGILLALDGRQEREIGVGRKYPERWEVIGDYEIVVSQSIADTLSLLERDAMKVILDLQSVLKLSSQFAPGQSFGGVGDNTTFAFDVTDQVAQITNVNVFTVANATLFIRVVFTNESIVLHPTLVVDGVLVNTGQSVQFSADFAPLTLPDNIMLDYQVVGVSEKSYGKWPGFLGNVALVESTTIPHILANVIRDFAAGVNGTTTFTFNPASFLNATVLEALNATLIDLLTNVSATGEITPATLQPFLPFLIPPGVNFTITGFNFTGIPANNLTLLLDALNTTVEVDVDLNPLLRQSAETGAEQVETIRMADFAMTTIGMMESKFRMKTYLSSPEDMGASVMDTAADFQRKLTWWSESLDEGMPHDYPPLQADIQAPLLLALEGSSVLRNFIDMVFFGVYVMLVVLSCLVIYALLLDDVETKTYEYGMLRALGLPHRTLALVLLLESMVFSIPGTMIGLAIAYGIVLLVFFLMTRLLTSTPMVYTLPISAWASAMAVGIFMPVVANIAPIRAALKTSLRTSLDVYHGATQRSGETSVTVKRLTSLGIKPGQTILSLILVAAGMVTYYVIPYAFIFGKFGLLLRIMTLVLLGMVVGLSVVSLIVQPVISRLVVSLSLWWRERRVKPIVQNNLKAHRGRNLKTAAIFMLALSYILFASAMFLLQSETIITTVELFSGADLVAVQPSTKGVEGLEGLPVKQLRQYLEVEPRVASYAFLTFPLGSLQYVDRTYAGNLVGFRQPKVAVYGVDESLLNTGFKEFVKVRDKSDSISLPETRGNPDPIKSLYTNAGRVRLSGVDYGYVPPIIPSPPYPYTEFQPSLNTSSIEAALRSTYTEYVDLVMSQAFESAGIGNAKFPLSIKIDARLSDEESDISVFEIGAAHALVSKLPGFFYSSYAITATNSPVLMSHATYAREVERAFGAVGKADVLPEGWPDPDVMPMQRVMVRMRDGSSEEDRRIVANGMLTFTDDDVLLTDTEKSLESARFASSMLQYFFNVIAALSLVLCFFSLWLSFTANVRENSWEYGVLRSIGVSGFKLTRASVYEALSLTLVALVLGTAVGIVIATTLTLQFNLFLENEFSFNFPYIVFGTTVVLLLFVSVLGSALPSIQLYRRGITQVLRGQT